MNDMEKICCLIFIFSVVIICTYVIVKRHNVNKHSKKELSENYAGEYVSNPDAIREHFPIMVYYKDRNYWDWSFIERHDGKTYIWAIDGFDDITPEMEIYLSTEPERLEVFYDKYVKNKSIVQ